MLISTTTQGISEKVGDKEALRLIAEAGFDAFDYNMGSLNVSKDSPLKTDGYKEYIAELKKTAEKQNIVCNQAHAPFPSQIYGSEEYNRDNFGLIVRCMECASDLGAKTIVIHPIKERADGHGSTFSDYPQKSFKDRDEVLSANICFYNSLIPYAEKYNIKIALENLWIRNKNHPAFLLPSTCGTAGEFVKLLDRLDKNCFVGCLDIGHSLLAGEKPHEAIRALGKERLKVLHIHDVNGYEDSHVLPYQMSVDWEEVIKALATTGYDGDFTLEADNFIKKYPVGLLPDALKLMYKTAEYMVRQIENGREKQL